MILVTALFLKQDSRDTNRTTVNYPNKTANTQKITANHYGVNIFTDYNVTFYGRKKYELYSHMIELDIDRTHFDRG